MTSRASYTTAAGSFQVASVDLQTDSTGDITQSANGGVIIHSYSEGSPTPATTFVAERSDRILGERLDRQLAEFTGVIDGGGGRAEDAHRKFLQLLKRRRKPGPGGRVRSRS